MEVETFKRLLENYRNYKEELIKAQQYLDEVLWYELSGVKGVRFDKEPVHSYNPQLSEQRRLELVDQIEEKEAEIKMYKHSLHFTELKLRHLAKDDKEVILKILADNVSYEKMGNKKGYTNAGMWKKVERDLKSIL